MKLDTLASCALACGFRNRGAGVGSETFEAAATAISRSRRTEWSQYHGSCRETARITASREPAIETARRRARLRHLRAQRQAARESDAVRSAGDRSRFAHPA